MLPTSGPAYGIWHTCRRNRPRTNDWMMCGTLQSFPSSTRITIHKRSSSLMGMAAPVTNVPFLDWLAPTMGSSNVARSFSLSENSPGTLPSSTRRQSPFHARDENLDDPVGFYSNAQRTREVVGRYGPAGLRAPLRYRGYDRFYLQMEWETGPRSPITTNSDRYRRNQHETCHEKQGR